jgi:hypothetical protein
MLSLAKSEVLDEILTKIFSHADSVCLGQSFKGDLLLMKRCLPEMKFWHKIQNYVDIGVLH